VLRSLGIPARSDTGTAVDVAQFIHEGYGIIALWSEWDQWFTPRLKDSSADQVHFVSGIDVVAGFVYRKFTGTPDCASTPVRLESLMNRWAEQRRGQRTPMIAGTTPRADLTAAEPSLHAALAEREAAILKRAAVLVHRAADDPASWLRTIHMEARDTNFEQLIIVAANRDRHDIAEGDPRPLGGPPRGGGTARANWRVARADWKAVSTADRHYSPDSPPVSSNVWLEKETIGRIIR